MSILSNAIQSMKSQYVPVIDNKVKMTIQGDIACPSDGEYHAFINGELTAVPEDLLISVPVFRISKPIDQIQPGDIIKTSAKKVMKSGNVDPEGKYTYRKVLEVKDGKIVSMSFGGSKSTQTPIKDFFFGQKTASVVVNMFTSFAGGQNAFGNMNPMMMMMLFKDGESSDLKKLLPFMMMQNGGAQGINPMMFALMNDGGADMSDALMLMMMQQNGGIQNMFSGLTPVATTTEAPAADTAASTEA